MKININTFVNLSLKLRKSQKVEFISLFNWCRYLGFEIVGSEFEAKKVETFNSITIPLIYQK